MEITNSVECLVCDSTVIKHEYSLDYGQILRCEKCGLVFTKFKNIETRRQADATWDSGE